MFIVFLKFSENKSEAPKFMDAHNMWLKNGFEKGLFLASGTIKPSIGGAIIAQAASESVLGDYINQDPFVMENVVKSEIIEIDIKKSVDELQFLLKG